MPRPPRISRGGYVYHVLNRTAGRRKIFREEEDYAAFERTLGDVQQRLPTRLLSYCLMPDHWHLILWPRSDGQLSEFLRLLTVTHTQRWHAQYRRGGTGPLYQGRFRSFPIQRDQHLLMACRYVEASALAARLVGRAQDWPWGSAAARRRGKERPEWLLADDQWPLERPPQWVTLLNRPQTKEERQQFQTSETRGRPLGEDAWVRRTAVALSLESTLRPRGRPRKEADEQ